MVDGTVVEDKHTSGAWMRIHLVEKAFQPLHEIVAIIATSLDVAINYTIQ
jgi:hypothetical protein